MGRIDREPKKLSYRCSAGYKKVLFVPSKLRVYLLTKYKFNFNSNRLHEQK